MFPTVVTPPASAARRDLGAARAEKLAQPKAYGVVVVRQPLAVVAPESAKKNRDKLLAPFLDSSEYENVELYAI